jgi:hypothetical protein
MKQTTCSNWLRISSAGTFKYLGFIFNSHIGKRIFIWFLMFKHFNIQSWVPVPPACNPSYLETELRRTVV